MTRNISSIRIIRNKHRIVKCEFDDGYGKVIDIPITGFEYEHGVDTHGVVKIGFVADRVRIVEAS